MKNILIIGKNGFLGFHLEIYFKYHLKFNVLDFNRDNWPNISSYLNEADTIIFNSCIIKGQNIFEQNKKIVDEFISSYKQISKNIDIILVSSSKRNDNTEYGKAKLYAEESILKAAKEKKDRIKIIITPNIFGPFSIPNYNSAIATFCFNELNNLPSSSNNNPLELVYVTDLVKLISDKNIFNQQDEFIYVNKFISTYKSTADEILQYIKEIKKNFDLKKFNFNIADLYKKLYITFLSFVPKEQMFIPHDLKIDERGWLFEYNDYELVNTDHFFISSTSPLKIRGNHFHLEKFEKFTFLKGRMKINFQNLKTKEIFSFIIDKFPQTIIIPPLFIHNIVSLEEKEESIILFYSNERFDKNNPDTYYHEI
jgi:UDP-2-acetamido-2,6-beta-L-arabino-hexul-4-ose reductase